MSPATSANYVHLVASVNLDGAEGRILYVNPTDVTSATPTEPSEEAVALVIRDHGGAQIDRVTPQVRLEACQDADAPRIGLIQQDIAVREGTASIDLMLGDMVLDTFTAGEPETAGAVSPSFGLGPPMAGGPHRRAFAAADVGEKAGVTYMIQARPDNEPTWITLAVGQKTPKFVIDKNQFPGATKLDVRVIQSTGFTQSTIQTKQIALED